MEERNHAYYAAFQAKDTRFDGRFFVGITSTGIYCRPICKAKPAKEENCVFFSSAVEAEAAGYRPCLLCRPELAPGSSPADASFALAYQAAGLLEEICGSDSNLAEIAAELGCTGRHLRRVFAEAFHVTPIRYLQTCRLLLAKNLLTDTKLPVLEVAMASGFGSLRRLNDLFRERYHLSPTALRKSVGVSGTPVSGVTVFQGYRPPYPWESLLKFLEARAIPEVEKVEGGRYFRTVRLKSREGKVFSGWICVGNDAGKNRLAVTLSDTLIPALPRVLSRVRSLFDLYLEPEAVYEDLGSGEDVFLKGFILGTRLPGCFDSFEMAVRAVLGQQITVKAAGTLAGRTARCLGSPIETGISGLTRLFPAPEEILACGEQLEESLGALGILASRSKTIRMLADGLESGELRLNARACPEKEMEKLQKIRGIGKWTAHYLAMRTMGWPDAFLETDVGIRKALPGYSEKERLALAERWRPWRSYAMIHLWNTR